jgi:hypothetical protein
MKSLPGSVSAEASPKQGMYHQADM